ncbi:MULTISPECIES: hypothetical protein [Kocuria]|uniref:hypothetical protein n=1 Tax=Kocuria TaxID=57493 RepID=UPI000F88F46C|nr:MULTISPECIES: hypothetical protein [Kocuria]RUP84627.1 hypothetical protein D8M39_03070 [Kocuria sp. HSID17590]RUQ13507.1 hypothetical protein D8M38_00500 [Kocuria sp. HSID17582]
MVETAAITDYLARALQRGRLDEVAFGDDPYVAVPRSLLRSGYLPEEQTQTLFDAHDDVAAPSDGESSDGATDGEDGADDKDRPPLSVVVSTVSLELPGGGHTGLLLLEAKLFPDGRLEPVLETASSPWIPSERLSSPMIGDWAVMVGDLDAFWAFSRQQLGAGVSQTTSFAGALDLADSLFAAVAGRSAADFAAALSGNDQDSGNVSPPVRPDMPGSGRVEHDLCFVRELDRVNAVGPLLDLYDHVADHGAPPLLERMCQGWSGARIAERAIHEGEGLYEAMKLSCGSMSDGFPLTPSQRRAVHAFLSGEEGDVTAVSGPPGTGKTMWRI